MTTTEWLIDAVQRSGGKAAPVFEEARARGVSQREFHAALDNANLTLTDFGERIRRARTAAKPSGAPASKAQPPRSAKPTAAQERRAVASFAAVAAVLRERKRAEEQGAAAAGAAASVKPAAVKPAVRINPAELWAKYSTSPGGAVDGRHRDRR